jgi:hypothetical protein
MTAGPGDEQNLILESRHDELSYVALLAADAIGE